jgi:hypothetical protein
LHAAALFALPPEGSDGHPRLAAVHEDVGRHNAVDKLIGRRFLVLSGESRVVFDGGGGALEDEPAAAWRKASRGGDGF